MHNSKKRKGRFSAMSDEAFRIIISHMNHRALNVERDRNVIITCDLILEEDTSTQDEFQLFKYMCSLENCCFEPYYIMNEHSPEFQQIKAQYGSRIIPYCREKHRSFALKLNKLLKRTKFICSGFQVMHALGIGITDAVKKSPYVYAIFTQHGVNFFKDNFISQSAYSSFIFDKIMISNEFEKKLFMERGCYEEKNLIKNGLFRWDLLKAEGAHSEKSIFIYFTHRRYLKSMKNVQDSVYVKSIAGLLSDPRFTRLVKEQGYTLKVALHHTVLSVCGKELLDGIHILEDAEIAAAKRDSAILITDYSSMCFEMWFQHKPVIFFNIADREDCETYGHKTDLPLPYAGKEDYIFNVAETPAQCIDMLESYIKSGFKFTSDDKVKRDKFFYYNSGFCERFYNYLAENKNSQKDMYHIGYGETISFSNHSDIYTEGVHFPDSEGRWIVCKKAKLMLNVPQSQKELEINIKGLPHPKSSICGIRLGFNVNGRFICTKDLNEPKLTEIILTVPAGTVGADGKLIIDITAGNINNKKEIVEGINTQSRLSLKLTELTINQK